MSHKNIKKQQGIIKYIILFFIGILILSYLGFNIEEFMETDTTKNNLNYVAGFSFELWENNLKPIYDFFLEFLGPYIDDTINRLKNHQDFISPNVPTVVPNFFAK